MRVYFDIGFLYCICGGVFLYFVRVSFAWIIIFCTWYSSLQLVFWIV